MEIVILFHQDGDSGEIAEASGDKGMETDLLLQLLWQDVTLFLWFSLIQYLSIGM